MFAEAEDGSLALLALSRASLLELARFMRGDAQAFAAKAARVVVLGSIEPLAAGLRPADDGDERGLAGGGSGLEGAQFVFAECQRLGVPLVAVARGVGDAAPLPAFVYEELAAIGHPVAARLHDAQIDAAQALWERAAAPTAPTAAPDGATAPSAAADDGAAADDAQARMLASAARRGLPAHLDRAWFARTFCGGATALDDVPAGAAIWSHIQSLTTAAPLALLCATPACLQRFFKPTAVAEPRAVDGAVFEHLAIGAPGDAVHHDRSAPLAPPPGPPAARWTGVRRRPETPAVSHAAVRSIRVPWRPRPVFPARTRAPALPSNSHARTTRRAQSSTRRASASIAAAAGSRVREMAHATSSRLALWYAYAPREPHASSAHSRSVARARPRAQTPCGAAARTVVPTASSWASPKHTMPLRRTGRRRSRATRRGRVGRPHAKTCSDETAQARSSGARGRARRAPTRAPVGWSIPWRLERLASRRRRPRGTAMATADDAPRPDDGDSAQVPELEWLGQRQRATCKTAERRMCSPDAARERRVVNLQGCPTAKEPSMKHANMSVETVCVSRTVDAPLAVNSGRRRGHQTVEGHQEGSSSRLVQARVTRPGPPPRGRRRRRRRRRHAASTSPNDARTALSRTAQRQSAAEVSSMARRGGLVTGVDIAQ